MRRTAAQDRRGFTLVELLVSVVILSVGIVVILHAFERALFAVGSARDHIWSDLLASETISEMDLAVMTDDIEGMDSDDGDFEEPYDAFSWETEIEQRMFEDNTDEVTNYIYFVEVTIAKSAIDKELVVQTMRTE
ncbi:hypothetical protein BVX97_00710 [bacterium E08(2017)]|nr:hypothetical protein BVX97_00710 [bacterium E08(2017)]